MKNFSLQLLSTFFIFISFFGFSQKQTSYKISGEFAPEIKIDSVSLFDENFKRVKTVPVIDQKFVITGTVKTPQKYSIGNEKLNVSNPIILENSNYTYNADPSFVNIKGGKLHNMVIGYYSNPEYQKLNAERNRIMNEQFMTLDMNNEEAVKKARKIVNEASLKVYDYDNKILNGIIESKTASTMAKLFALTSSYDYKTYPVEKRMKLLDIYQKQLGTHPSLTAYRNFLKMGNDVNAMAKSVEVGKPYKEFFAKDREGKDFLLSDAVRKNKYTLLEFWASWCAPCRAEIPNLKKAYAKYKDAGFEIFSVSLDESSDKWKTALNKENPNWINVLADQHFNNPFAKSYGISGLPSSFLISSEGIIVAKNEELREFALDKTLDKFFNKKTENK